MCKAFEVFLDDGEWKHKKWLGDKRKTSANYAMLRYW